MIENVRETGSTNADLLARISAGEHLLEGAWLIADRQSSGRGRHGRVWEDSSGNFMGSTIIDVRPADPPAATLALVAALAVYEATVPLLDDPGALMLKWPNDLLLCGAKLVGILLERSGDKIVAGIGVNLASAPSIEGRATTSLASNNVVISRDNYAARLTVSLAAEIDRWRTYGLEAIVRRWVAAAHPVGTSLTVSEQGQDGVTGTFAGLSCNGALQLRLADGAIRAIHTGDVFLA